MRVLMVNLLGAQLYGRALQTWYQQDWSAPLHWLQLREQPDGSAYERVTALYNIAREHFLAHDYDAFFAVEADMVLPRNAVARLAAHLAHGYDAAYGLYVWRHGTARYWSAYSGLTDSTGESIIVSAPERARAVLEAGASLETNGVGLGCTLISRRAIERFPFQLRGGACCDWYFAADLVKTGWHQVTDFGVVCGHMTNEPVLLEYRPALIPERWWDAVCHDPRVTV